MANLAKELARQLSRFPEARVEFELRYLERDPPSSAFAYDLLHLDREVRRAAREVRDGLSRGPIGPRRHRRPLGIDQGLIVVESHRSDFAFLLEVPPELYKFILSEPVEFAERVFELGWIIGGGTRHVFLRRRRTKDVNAEQEPVTDALDDDIPADVKIVPDEGASGGTFERVQRIRFPDGEEYELAERVERRGT